MHRVRTVRPNKSTNLTDKIFSTVARMNLFNVNIVLHLPVRSAMSASHID